MNTWEPFSTDSSVKMEAGSWALLRTTFTAPAAVAQSGGALLFPALGLAQECWLNGVSCAWEPVEDGRRRRVQLPPGAAAQTLVLVLHAPRPATLFLPFAPTLTPTQPGKVTPPESKPVETYRSHRCLSEEPTGPDRFRKQPKDRCHELR